MPFINYTDGVLPSSGDSSSSPSQIARAQNIKLTQLWTNESPTSVFSGQTIQANLSKYNLFFIEYLLSTGNYLLRHTAWCRNDALVLLPFVDEQAQNYGGRRCKMEQSKGFSFGDAYNHTGTVANKYAIPLNIYGAVYDNVSSSGSSETPSNAVTIAQVDSDSSSDLLSVSISGVTELNNGLFFVLQNQTEIQSEQGCMLQVNDLPPKQIFMPSGEPIVSNLWPQTSYLIWYDASLDDGNGGFCVGSFGDDASYYVHTATTDTAGIVKYDGETIQKNADGQLYVASAPSAAGTVPTPAAGDDTSFLQGDSTWYKLNIRNGTGTNSVVVNRGGRAVGAYSYAEGVNTYASGDYSHAEGWGPNLITTDYGAHGEASHAEGEDTLASGTASHAEGSSTSAVGDYAHSEGATTIAREYSAHAEGTNTEANGGSAHAEGEYTLASGLASHAEGTRTVASGASSHAEGNRTEANGTASHAEGTITKATHRSQHVFGECNIFDPSQNSASNRGTYIEIVGNGTDASNRSNARTLDWNGNEVLAGSLSTGGDITVPNGSKFNGSGAGLSNVPLTAIAGLIIQDPSAIPVMTGASSSAAGTAGTVPTPAKGDQKKYLQGDGTWDTPAARHGSGYSSVVEGINTTASGDNSHAEGNGSVASGGNSHAEGYYTTASGHYSHAEGTGVTASGNYSHAEGVATVANHKSQHVFGEYNVSDGSSAASTARGNYIEIVGNGESTSNRANARTLDWSGNEVLAGTLTTGGDITVPSGSKFNGSGAGLTNIPASALQDVYALKSYVDQRLDQIQAQINAITGG